MKKYLVLILVIVLSIPLMGCKSSPEDEIPWDQLEFEVETNPDYIGSYVITRSNYFDEWYEWGEWESEWDLFFSKPICFGAFEYGDTGTFRVSEDFVWKQVDYFGRSCIKITKK